MPSLPYVIGITATKSDGSAYVGTVWLINEETGDVLQGTSDSVGHAVFDCANFNQDYSNGDVLTYAIEAYANPSFYLTRKSPFDDSSVENIDFNEEKLNTATCTVNMKLL